MGAEEVDDVVQSTLAEALAMRELPIDETHARRLVFVLARQKVADAHRRRARESRRITDGSNVESCGAEGRAPTDLLDWAGRQLPTDPAAKRTLAWLLREADGETLAEIAAEEGIPPEVVRKRVSRLRRLFRMRWAKELAFVSTALLVSIVLLATWQRKTTKEVIVAPRGDVAPSTPSAKPSHLPAIDPIQPAPRGSSSAAPRGRPLSSSAAPPPSARPFDDKAARAQLQGVSLSSCVDATTRPAAGRVAVTFASDGTVAAARIISGTLRGSPEASCIEGRFAGLRVTAFAGAMATRHAFVQVGPDSAATFPQMVMPAGGAPALPRFDSAHADAILRAIDASSCFGSEDGAANRMGLASVTLHPSGRAVDVHVVWPGAKPAIVQCISALLGKASVPPFGSGAVRMTASFTSPDAKAVVWSPFRATPVPDRDPGY